MKKQMMEYEETSHFFSAVLDNKYLKQIWELNNNNNNHNKYFEFKHYDKEANKIEKSAAFYIVKPYKELPHDLYKKLMDNKAIPHELAFISTERHAKNSQYLFASQQKNYINEFATTISSLDLPLGLEILNVYHNYMVTDSQEVDKLQDHIIMQEKSMRKYLIDNDVVFKPIDINLNNRQEFENYYKQINKLNPITFRDFNDCDITPMMIGNTYIISDSSSAKLFIHKIIDDNKSAWYCVPRHFGRKKEDDDSINELKYLSNMYITDAIESGCNDFTLVAQIENGKFVKATSRICQLNSLQSFVCNELEAEGSLTYQTPTTFTFEDRMACAHLNHRWSDRIDSIRASLDYLSNVEIKDGKIDDHRFTYFSHSKYLPFKLPHTNEEINFFNNFLEDEKAFKNLQQADNETKKDIRNYLHKHIKPVVSLDNINLVITKLENILDMEPIKTKKNKY